MVSSAVRQKPPRRRVVSIAGASRPGATEGLGCTGRDERWRIRKPSGLLRPRNWSGSRSGIVCSTIPSGPSSSGSWAARSTSSTTPLTGTCIRFRKNKLALIWESEDGKEHQTFSYYAMNREVSRMANIIKAMGVSKGDRVTIYLGRIPQIIFAMLACAKIGAVHSVVFGGFSVDSLQGRIDDSESKLVITADGSYNNGKVVELKRTVDEALRHCPSVENVIVIKRIGHEVPMEAGRDHWYHEMLALPIANGKCATEVMDCRRSRSTSSTLRAPRASPRPSCTHTAATWSGRTAR